MSFTPVESVIIDLANQGYWTQKIYYKHETKTVLRWVDDLDLWESLSCQCELDEGERW